MFWKYLKNSPTSEICACFQSWLDAWCEWDFDNVTYIPDKLKFDYFDSLKSRWELFMHNLHELIPLLLKRNEMRT